MVYIREISKTRAILTEHICPDVVVLIEDYLIPIIDINSDYRRNLWQKLGCGFAEYVEMEIGNREVIENMFIDVCKQGCLGDAYALLSAGARNLKTGLATAILFNNNHIARLLVALDAIDSSLVCPDLISSTHDYLRVEFIRRISSRPDDIHLLSLFGTINYPDEIMLGIRECVKSGLIIGIEILISKISNSMYTMVINEALLCAVLYSKIHIIEYAIDSGADIQICIDHAKRVNNQDMIDYLLNKCDGRDAKRQRCAVAHSD